jgi:hypothetical protein
MACQWNTFKASTGFPMTWPGVLEAPLAPTLQEFNLSRSISKLVVEFDMPKSELATIKTNI